MPAYPTIQRFVPDGFLTTFVLDAIPAPGSLLLIYNGLALNMNVDFTLSNVTITTGFIPALGANLIAYFTPETSLQGAPNSGIDLTTLAAVKQWAGVGMSLNQPGTIPASSPYKIQTNIQTNLGVFYANGPNGAAGSPLTEVDSGPSQGQYTFASGLYMFAAADANGAIIYNGIAASNDDNQIQACITAWSAYVLHKTGRGPMDGSVPTLSPFVQPVAYDEWYDGTGTQRLPIRNWPVRSVDLVQVNGATIPQSTNINTSGWVVDGDGAFISIRGGFSPFVATFQNYGYQGLGRFGARGGFTEGIQNVNIQYTAGFFGVPDDLEIVARKTVALNYVRRGWIGQKSQALAQGGGTVSFGTWEMDADAENTIKYYRRHTG